MGSFAWPKAELPTQTERAPWFVATLEGQDHNFTFVNDTFAAIFGTRRYAGCTVGQIFPEVTGQVYPELLDKIFKTGSRVSLKDSGIQTRAAPDGPLVDRHIDINYVPTLDAKGRVSGIYLEGFVSTTNPMALMSRRAIDNGLKALSDADILALILYQQNNELPAQDTADQLLGRFDGLGGVLSASMADLERIAPLACPDRLRTLHASTALHLNLIRELGSRVLRQKVGRRPVLSSSVLVQAFLLASLRHETREQFRVLFLDHGNKLIADEVLGQGSISQVAVYSREVIRRALELAAAALILVHNHPGGSRTISANDRAMTVEIVRAGQALGINIHDHLIVAGDSVISLAAAGLLKSSGAGR